MAKTREPVNPFYLLLVALGVAFSVTAFAYYVMAYRAIAPAAAGQVAGRDVGPHVLTAFLDRHGITILAWELGLLAVATVGAMWLDRFRALRPGAPAELPGETEAEPNGKVR